MAYDVNDAERVTFTYRNSGGTLANPTVVTATITTPAGVATTYTYGVGGELVRDSTGVYHIDVTFTAAGTWTVEGHGTGAVVGATTQQFIVGTNNGYCTLAELRDELGITDTVDDDKLTRSINAASRQIDHYCGQRFWQDPTPVTREFYADDLHDLYLDDFGDGIATISGLVVSIDETLTGVYNTTLTSGTDFLLLPRNAAADGQPYTELRAGLTSSSHVWPQYGNGRATVQITARWGWPTVPDDVTKACLIQSAQLYKAKDTAFDVAGETQFGVVRVRAGLNRTAQALLSHYAKPGVG